MGVKGLWDILLTIAQTIPIEQLSGKRIAIDASIWIVKINSIFNQDKDRLKSIISKIAMMKRYNILPVFVFDGQPPILKRKTLEERRCKKIIAGDLQARKRTEIEVIKRLQDRDYCEKSRRASRNEQRIDELNEALQKLKKVAEDEKETRQIALQKISMQSDILNMKYRVMLDINPEYYTYESLIELEDYMDLGIEQKMEYLDELEEFKWRNIKYFRRHLKSQESLTQEQKLIKDLKVIEKRSVIRQLQDNLYRKIMQKNTKVEDGFQIIETIYNGKKVIQKRKISNHPFTNGFSKNKMKNDIKVYTQLGQQDAIDNQSNEKDDFLSQFCSTDSRKIPEKYEIREFKNKEERNHKKKLKQQSDSEENNELRAQRVEECPENYYQTFISLDQQQRPTSTSRDSTQLGNKDNLPNFVPTDQQRYSNQSQDNLQLQNLFGIMGIPFVIAAGEAEAQCAILQEEGIVDGIATEDSDVFLFGGRNVYRGLFQNNIKEYSLEKIKDKLRLNRQKMIILALLLGSDYTDGVKGVGIVNGMEIVKVFDTFQKLDKFKKWAQHADILLPPEQQTVEMVKNAKPKQIEFYELHQRFKNSWFVPHNFPQTSVIRAYQKPSLVPSSQLHSMQASKHFEQKECDFSLFQNLLRSKLDMGEKEIQHYKKLMSFRFARKGKETLKDYLQYVQKEEEALGRIKSKRLLKSISENE